MKAKKLIATFTSLFAIVPIISSAPIASAATGDELGVNIIQNPGFEDVQNGVPNPWDALNKWANDKVTVTSGAAHSGNYGIRIDKSWIGENADVEFKPYEWAGWMKCDVPREVQLKVEYYRDTVDSAGYIGGDRKFVNISSDWVKNEFQFIPPEGANKVKAYFMTARHDGVCYFDDAALYRIKQLPGVNVMSNQVFYYQGETQGSLDGTIWPDDQIPDGKTYDVTIAPKDGGAPIVSQQGIPVPADGNMSFSFNPQLMSLHVPYVATIDLKDAQGNVLHTGTQNIYNWERPTMMRQDGTLMVDGKPFVPIFGYHVLVKDYSRVGEAVNTVQTVDNNRKKSTGMPDIEKDFAAIQNQLDEAQKYGLKVVLSVYNSWTATDGPKGWEYLNAIVNKFKDHPALLAWYLDDEPDLYNRPNDQLENTYIHLREADPVHPVYLVVNSGSTYKNYFRFADVLAEDLYPLPSGINAVGNAVHMAKSLFPNRPVWSILQAFTKANWPYLPSITEVRNMAYQSVLEGSQSISYYAFNDTTWNMFNSPLYPGLVEFNKTEVPYITDIIANLTETKSYKDDNVQWGIWQKDNHMYAIAVNLTQDTKNVSIPLTFGGYDVKTIAPEASESSMVGDHLSVTLPGYESTLIDITPFTSVVENSEVELLGSKLLIQHPHWPAYIDTIQQQLQMLDQALVSGQPDLHDALTRSSVVLTHLDNLSEWLTQQTNIDGDKDKALGALAHVRGQIQMIHDTIANHH